MNPYEFAVTTARDAGLLIRDGQTKRFDVDMKGGDPRDVVTSVDLEANTFICDRIRSAFPDHTLYSEESGGEEVGENVWAVDPIDGSSNYARGIPHFSTVISLLRHGEPVLGAVYNPMTDELFSFEKGKGAQLNGNPIRVSDITDLSAANVFFHAGRKEELRAWGGESYRRLLGSAKKTGNYGSSALDACFVAAGRIEANIYGRLSTLDVACALGILFEAGGIASDRQGNPLTYSSAPVGIYMANNQEMLTTVRTLLESPS